MVKTLAPNWEKELASLPQGWALTPVKEKSPLRPSWQSEQPIARDILLQLLSEGELLKKKDGSKWHCRWTGIGLRLGKISGNLIAIDLDGASAQTEFQLMSDGDIPITVSWTSGRPGRRQLLCHLPDEVAELASSYKITTGPDEYLEFRWSPLQSVLPPSVHPKTGRYQWINSPVDTPVAEAPQWLIEFIRRNAVISTPIVQQPYIPVTGESLWDTTDWALSYLSALAPWRADDYKCWLDVGMALHSVSESLLSEWEQWSRNSSKFKQGECEREWNRFSPSGGIGIGTLAIYAKEDGWRSPFPKREYQPASNKDISPPNYPKKNVEYGTSKYVKHLPSLPEAEIQLLGLLLLDLCNPLDVLGTIRSPLVFHEGKHQLIYEAMLSLHAKRLPTSIVSVLDHLKAINALDSVGGKEYLIYLTDCQHNSMRGTSASECASLLINKWIRRELIKVSSQIQTNAYDQQVGLEDVLDSSERILYGVRNLQEKKNTLHSAEVSSQTYDKLYNPNRIYPSGFTTLDKHIVGWEDETLSVIAARSSMGKTATALQAILQFALLHDRHCAYFSLEMTREQLMHRLWSLISVHPHFSGEMLTPLSGKRIRLHLSKVVPFTEEELANVARIAEIATSLNLSIDDCRNITPQGIASECRKLKSQSNGELGMVIIDYLQLFSAGAGDAAETSNRLLETTRYFYNMAQELKCPVVLLAQVSRAPEGRKDKRPSMSDLAQSGGVEWIADNIILLYRESYYNADSDDTLELICDKVRQGETGIAKVGYDLDRQLLYELPW